MDVKGKFKKFKETVKKQSEEESKNSSSSSTRTTKQLTAKTEGLLAKLQQNTSTKPKPLSTRTRPPKPKQVNPPEEKKKSTKSKAIPARRAKLPPKSKPLPQQDNKENHPNASLPKPKATDTETSLAAPFGIFNKGRRSERIANQSRGTKKDLAFSESDFFAEEDKAALHRRSPPRKRKEDNGEFMPEKKPKKKHSQKPSSDSLPSPIDGSKAFDNTRQELRKALERRQSTLAVADKIQTVQDELLDESVDRLKQAYTLDSAGTSLVEIDEEILQLSNHLCEVSETWNPNDVQEVQPLPLEPFREHLLSSPPRLSPFMNESPPELLSSLSSRSATLSIDQFLILE